MTHKDHNADRVRALIGWAPPDEFLRLWEGKAGREAEAGGLDDDDGGSDRSHGPPKNDPKTVLNLWA